MDDSDPDFVDLYSKLLKRVRKKPGESIQPRTAEQQQQQQQQPRRRNHRRDPGAGTQPVAAAGAGETVGGGAGHDSGDAGSSVAASDGPRGSPAKDRVLHRMQQFKRAGPRRMVHGDTRPTAGHEKDGVPPPPPRQSQDTPHSFSSGLHPEPGDNDEALALRLQQQLDREAAEARTADLEDRGLFFCQICHRALSHMTPEGRTQHLNRCLDDSEESAPAPPPPPAVSDCPICGKKFKSQKSRSAHLKRCSSDMGVAPAVLLQALQRQTEETQNVSTDHTLAQTSGTKRKGPSKPGLPRRKKPRKKDAPLDEDTMVALALSSSLLEQGKQAERESETNTAASHTSTTASLKRPDKGKSRAKRRKGGVLRPPPLLLVQDAQVALARLQERVSALLLRGRAPSPPTPPRRPSRLPGCSGAAVLWQRSALLGGGASTCPSDFYTPELQEFITPWEPATTEAAINNPQASVQPGEGTPVPGSMASIPSSSSQTSTSQTTPSTSRALLVDLMELAEDGVTLTQCGHAAWGPDKGGSTGQTPTIHLSGFVVEESEEQADLCASGFLPGPAGTHSEDARCPARRTTAERRADEDVALSRLASDLSSMVNNPQLSDVQLQVDSGEVFFAHSFMLYARCPLLAEMAHERGFGVREEGEPAARLLLMNDVPGQALLVLLQYLYTARCSIPAALRAHVLELAARFDLQELQSLCEQDPDQGDHTDREGNVASHTDQALTELLRSMWGEEDEDGEGMDTGAGRDEDRELVEDHQGGDPASGDREGRGENVNEEELEEIYEFAATQRMREEEQDGTEEDEVEDGGGAQKNPTESKRSPSGLQPDAIAERSFSRLFSDSPGVYGEEDASASPSTSAPAEGHRSPGGPSLLRSSASVVDGLSVSPPLAASNMPVPGWSPGQAGAGGDEGTGDVAAKRESSGPRGICVPRGKKEPELIVLSDSSEELESVHSSRSPSPQKRRGYTLIKPDRHPPLSTPSFGPDDPSAAPVESEPGAWCDQDPADCSPEVSWLIPSTPVQPARSTAASSTQTKSSMCRTQLFPKGDPSGPSAFSSPAPPVDHRVRTPRGAACGSALAGPTGGSVPTSMPEETCGSDLNLCAERPGGCGALAPGRPKQDTPLHAPPRPYSSTPLHAELHGPPAAPAASPLLGHLEHSWTRRGPDRAPPERRERTALGSFRLSPLPVPKRPASPPSYAALRGRPGRSHGHSDSGPALKGSGLGSSEGERAHPGGDEGQQEEGGDRGAESTFQQSFMDEPPIAFNDSWGFDAADFGANPGRFSLALEESGASSQRGERSPGPPGAARSSSAVSPATDQRPSPCGPATASPPPGAHGPPAASGAPALGGLSFTPSPPEPPSQTAHGVISSLLDSRIWDSWDEEEEEDLPLCQRVNPSAQLQTPASSRNERRAALVPITPLPHYSDMDTPELKNKLNRFGVRPLPKRQMILKLKEIHQYTHQLVSSEEEEEEEAPSASRAAPTKPPTSGAEFPGSRPASCRQRVTFKAPEAVSTEEAEPLSASQGSSGESESRSNPELCLSSDSDSDEGVSASQSATRLKDSLRAVRSFILSNSELYGQILKYQPLVLSRLQEQLKAAGIRLGAAKLVDYLDSQCITFTTAKPGRAAPGRRRGKKAAGRKRAATAMI